MKVASKMLVLKCIEFLCVGGEASHATWHPGQPGKGTSAIDDLSMAMKLPGEGILRVNLWTFFPVSHVASTGAAMA